MLLFIHYADFQHLFHILVVPQLLVASQLRHGWRKKSKERFFALAFLLSKNLVRMKITRT